MGSFYSMQISAISFFADTTDAKDRARVFMMGESCFFAGFAIGPLLGGYLSRQMPNGPDDVFVIALILKTITIFLTLIFLPESLDVERRNLLISRDSLVKKVELLYQQASSSAFRYLLAGMVLMSLAASGDRGLFFFYVSYIFGWDSQDEGQYILAMSFCKLVFMAGLYPVLTKMFSKNISSLKGKAKFDISVILVTVFVATIVPLSQAFATKGWQLYIITVLEGFTALSDPTIKSLLSRAVASNNQGLLFSGISLVTQVVGLVAGVIFPLIWAITVKSVPSAFFLVSTCLYFSSLVLFGLGLNSDRLILSYDKDDQD